MKQEEEYLKIIGTLKQHKPVLANKDNLTDGIMRKIGAQKERQPLLSRLGIHLFDWANSFKWRLAMAAASVFLIGSFFLQQWEMQERLEHMENQLPESIDLINHQADEPGIVQKVMIKMVMRDHPGKDSIKVSRQDMELLMRDYLKLMNENKVLKSNHDNGFVFGNRSHTGQKHLRGL